MDRGEIVETIPHYAAMVLLMLVALNVVRVVAGDVGFWVEIGIAFAVVLVYRPVAIRLGVAPGLWTR